MGQTCGVDKTGIAVKSRGITKALPQPPPASRIPAYSIIDVKT